MTVTIVPAMAISRLRASSGVPWNASGECTPTVTCDSSAPAARAATTANAGITHSDPRAYSVNVSRRIMPSSSSPVPAQMAATPGPHSNPALGRRWSQPGMTTGHGG